VSSPSNRQAGVFLHLTSLPGAYGIGELGAAAFSFVDTVSAMGLTVWQFLPTGPVGYSASPYQSSSIYAGNPLLIDLASLRDEGLVTDSELCVFENLPQNFVDFRELVPLKTQLLEKVGERFSQSATETQRDAREGFIREHDQQWLHDYALFEVLKAKHQHRAWAEWEPGYANRDPQALRVIENTANSRLESIKTIQYLFFAQWDRLRNYAADRGIRLMGDVPIYAAMDSADTWVSPELFSIDKTGQPTEVAGVPPDYFSVDGQLWGNPLYRWDRHAADGYQWWISRVRHAIAMNDLVRFDHFRGFEAYWAIPNSAETARDGEWRDGPQTDLFDALVNKLGTLPIIAEDLGTITPEVDALRARYGFPGMKVLQFMIAEKDFDASQIPESSVCYTGTHDNDTTVGWFQMDLGDSAIEGTTSRQAEVLRNTGGRAESIHEDLIRLAFSTDARLVIIPMQDFLGLDSAARMNTPGVAENNWQWRLSGGQMTAQRRESVLRMVAESGRC
jgi:4-alpha-glucanotransferase